MPQVKPDAKAAWFTLRNNKLSELIFLSKHAQFARVVESVDTRDLKSLAE